MTLRIIAGEWGSRRIATPSGRGTRPTSDRIREAWFSTLGSRIRDARVLDLFAGSGALGLEALSRGARSATFVDRSRRAARVIGRNVAALGAKDRSRVVSRDVYAFLAELRDTDRGYDVALADPPYGEGHAARLLRHWEEETFAELLCLEHAPDSVAALDQVRPPAWRRSYGDTELSFYEARRPVAGDESPAGVHGAEEGRDAPGEGAR